MNHFIFLYPIHQIINYEIKNNQYRSENFSKLYSEKLNECIDLRYRQKNFKINYVIFNDTRVSKIINVRKEDKIIKAGLDFITHCKKKVYPEQDFIINQLEDIRQLVVGGFHMWDCVEKFAKRAYEREINVLVDEDLTEFFAGRLKDSDFKTNTYPTYNPKKNCGGLFEFFINARKERPWLWQDY